MRFREFYLADWAFIVLLVIICIVGATGIARAIWRLLP